MATLLQDLRYAIRLLAKSPGFTAIAVLTLALGIGANTAIFTVVNAVLLRPLGFRDPSSLVLVAEKSAFPTISTSFQNYIDWRDQSHSFESLEATRGTTITLTGAGEPERLNARMATAPLFSLLGVNAVLGRTFLADEDRAGGPPVAVLGYGLWQRRFGGSHDVLGKSITLDSQPYTVVGVLPSGFELLQPADVFLPFHPWAKTLPDDRNWHPGIFVIGRLKEGISREQGRTEMVAITKRLEEQYPIYNTGTSADVVGLQEQLVKNVRPALLLLLGAVAAVLLIACVNVANLLLARAAARGREVAIRTSMGATRWRVTRQLITESILLSVAGGTLGLLFAWASLGPLLKLSASTLPAVFAVSLDRWVLFFTLVVSLATGLLFGIVPALRTGKLDIRETLNEGSRGSTAGPGHHRIRGALVAAEIAMAMLLLVGAGLLLRSFSHMQENPPGFQADHLLVADLPLSLSAYSKPEQRFEFFDRLLERAKSLPGVRSAGAWPPAKVATRVHRHGLPHHHSKLFRNTRCAARAGAFFHCCRCGKSSRRGGHQCRDGAYLFPRGESAWQTIASGCHAGVGCSVDGNRRRCRRCPPGAGSRAESRDVPAISPGGCRSPCVPAFHRVAHRH